MRANEVDFIRLVQGIKQFQVPLYQRPYSWQDKQLEQLWCDITDEADRLVSGDSTGGHFIGSVVLAPHPHLAAGGVQRWLVVDGQQRLTTLMIALAAIRDHIRQETPDEADRIHDQYLVNRWQSGDDKLRLLPTQQDRDAFIACVLGKPGADTSYGVGRAYRFFKAALIAADDPDDDLDIARIEQVIRERLRLVEITSEPGDNVHRIFESLNNTGLKLSQADLVRNHLFMLLPTRSDEVYHDTWLPMQRRLGNAHLETLMWLDLILRGDDKAKQADLYRLQVERLKRLDPDEDTIVTEIVELARRSRHLEVILEPDKETDDRVRESLTRLRQWGGQVTLPISMLLLDHRERGRLSSDDVAKALSYIESFLVRRLLAGIPTNNLNRILNALPRELSQENLVGELHTYLSGTRRYWPNNSQLREAIRSKPFYYYGRGPQKTFILRRLEESFESPEPVDWEKAELTIEHVMPQTLSAEWVEQLTPEAQAENLSVSELHESVVHTLGNLTLSGRNHELSNHPFQRKNDILRSSALRMNQEIASTATWGRAEVLMRADELADRAIELWPPPLDRGEPDIEGRDWTQLQKALALVPAGTWTTYGDLAELIGSHPVPVGVHLANRPVPHAWRVLTSDGRPSPHFHWTHERRDDSQQNALETEGVEFDSSGRASTAQRLAADDLAQLLGLEVPVAVPVVSGEVEDAARYSRFLSQVGEAHPEAQSFIEALLRYWRHLGGDLAFGTSEETSCAPMLRFVGRPQRSIWPLTIYPRHATIEVVFQQLAKREPFDDLLLRRDFLDRLNLAPGIQLSEAKLNLRPSFAFGALANPVALAQVKSALEWFVVTCRSHVEASDAE